jgi:hypothetical protein
LSVNSTSVGVDKTTAEIISMLKTNIPNTDIFAFYDAIVCSNNKNINPEKLINEYKLVFLEKVVDLYNYINKNVETINNIYNRICIPSYGSTNPDKIYMGCFTGLFLGLYKVFLFDCLKLVESYYIIESLKQILENLFQLYPEFVFDKQIKENIKSVQNKFGLLTNYSNELLKFVYTINNPTSEQRKIGIEFIDKNIEYNWYFTDLVLLSAIIKNKIY